MPKSRRDRTIALTRTSKKQGMEHKEKVNIKHFYSLTLIREFLGPSPSAFSGKIPESSLVTSQLGLRK